MLEPSQDHDGRDVLSRPKEIGAVWPRKNGKTGGILTLDIIPVELAQRQGVIFLVPLDGDDDAVPLTRGRVLAFYHDFSSLSDPVRRNLVECVVRNLEMVVSCDTLEERTGSKLCFCDTKTLVQGLKRSPRNPA